MLEIVDGRGNARVIHTTQRLKQLTDFGIQKALFRSGRDLLSEFKQQTLSKTKTGKIYKSKDKGGRLRRHQSSAAGETPASRTGNYRKGGQFNVNGSSQLVFGNVVDYAGFLEEGTSRMKPRPGLKNAIKLQERNMLRNFIDGIDNTI